MFEALTLAAALSCGQVLGPPQPQFGAPRASPTAGAQPVQAAPRATLAQPVPAAATPQFRPAAPLATQPTAAPARPRLLYAATQPEGAKELKAGTVPAKNGKDGKTGAPTAPGPEGAKERKTGDPGPNEEKKGDQTAGETPEAPASAEEKKEEEPEEEEEAAPAGDRWILMKALQGTYPGYLLNGNRMQIYGWTTASYTMSDSSTDNNFPVVWNDRNETFLLNQHWTRIERTVVTSGTTMPTFGWRVDILAGSDYRFSLPRGLLNDQLKNGENVQSLYGVDPIAHYLEWYFPTVFQGLDLKVGRFFTPFGYESLETVSSPLVSKSYMFNYFPPFTHYGAIATANLSPTWVAQLAVVNGNDVALFDPAEEWRALATLKYIHPNQRDVVTFGTSVGRGRFNAGEPFVIPTLALASEPAGRNNINVFDLVWTHVINPRMNYGLEVGYGYQTNVPSGVAGGLIANDKAYGTAHWGGIVNYLTVNLSPKLTQVTRFELFDDFEGQRTGFEGLYTALTLGLQYKPEPWLMIRPEIRYDHNDEGRPFSNGTRNNQFTGAIDVTVRW